MVPVLGGLPVRIVRSVTAACFAAAVVLSVFDCAFAEPADDAEDNVASLDRFVVDQFSGEHARPDAAQFSRTPIDRDLADHFLYFSGIDLWRNGGFMHGGLVWSPDGLDRPGFTFKLLAAGGRYRYLSGTVDTIGDQLLVSAMPGWRFKFADLEIVVLGGIDVQNHRLDPDDPGNRLRGTHVGARGNVDIWYQPVESLMATLSFSGSTLGGNVWSRGALGWRMSGLPWVGPEVVTYSDGKYWQYRFGAHVTAWRTGSFEWSTGFGYVQDTDHRSGAYWRLGLISRQ